MSRFIYFIFLLSISQSMAMDSGKVDSDYKRRVGAKVIGVANILNQGVIAQVNKNTDEQEGKERKIWVRKESMGRIRVSPPKSPSITHVLAIKDIDEAHVLALTCFTHPKDDITYVVKPGKDGVLVHEVTPQDLPSYGPQPAGSNIHMDPNK